MYTNLTEDNVLLYAMHIYDNPQCLSIDEFYNDYNRIKYIKRLFSRYKLNEDLKEQLILNHIIVLANMFGVEGSVRLLFLRVDEVFYNILKSFLIFLGYMPERVHGIHGKNIISSDIALDKTVLNRLRELKHYPDAT